MKDTVKDLFNKLLPSGSDLKPYDWMIKATPQKEWIDQKGVYLWLAFFFSEIGAGLYFISLFYQYRTGLVLGWLITLVLGGIIHVLYLGNPFRAWRMFMKPNSSELSRGLWIIGAFAVLGFLQIITSGGFNPVFNVIMGILCLLIISHGFATMNVVRALHAWSSTVVLPLSIISGVWVGSQILQFLLAASGSPAAQAFEVWSKIFLLTYLVFLLLYLWGTSHTSEIARYSVNMMLKGDFVRLFYIGVILVGIVLPLILTLLMWGGSVNAGLVFLRLVFVFAGDLALRYTIMKSAYYKPLL